MRALRRDAAAAPSRALFIIVGRGDGVPRAATPPPRGAKGLHVSLAVAARADKNPKKRADASGTARYATKASLSLKSRRGNKS